MSQLHISLPAEKIASIGSFEITNSLLLTWIVMATIIIVPKMALTGTELSPSKSRLMVETVIEGLYGLFQSTLGSQIKIFFPLLSTLFLFIIAQNWIGLLPGVGTIGLYESTRHEGLKFIPLLRSGAADLNFTLALALISVIIIQIHGLKTLGKNYLAKFINFKSPVMFYVGILESISEIAKVISFSFRLFGNIFAGEVLLTVIAFLIPFLAPLPFLGLEIFVGFIQAMVFSMLTAVFIAASVEVHH